MTAVTYHTACGDCFKPIMPKGTDGRCSCGDRIHTDQGVSRRARTTLPRSVEQYVADALAAGVDWRDECERLTEALEQLLRGIKPGEGGHAAQGVARSAAAAVRALLDATEPAEMGGE